MIFVTVGTQDKQFTRLIKEVEKLVINGDIKDEVIIQAGHTKYESKYVKILNYIPYNEFNDYLNRADVIITHGGVGSILSSIKLEKKVIAVPRLFKYQEHVNDHQIQIVEKMDKNGYILGCTNLDDLKDKLIEINSFIPNKYISNTENFLDEFEKILEELLDNNY